MGIIFSPRCYGIGLGVVYCIKRMAGDGMRIIPYSEADTILHKPEMAKGLEKYIYIMDRLQKTNVSKDEEFQHVFRDFYQMRRFYSDDFAKHYFILMEQLKATRDISFRMAIERVKHIRCSYEMSFSSKLVHTINPLHPIWDSIVTNRHFGIKAPRASIKDRESACCQRYEMYEDRFYDYLSTTEAQSLIHLFDKRFPDNGISDVKKIDFILWQDRSKTN